MVTCSAGACLYPCPEQGVNRAPVAGRGVLSTPKIPLGMPPKLHPLCSTTHVHDGGDDNKQHLKP